MLLLRVAVCFLAGLGISVLVAWSAWAVRSERGLSRNVNHQGPHGWPRRAPGDWPGTAEFRIRSERRVGWARVVETTWHGRMPPGQRRTCSMHVHEVGWPRPCVAATVAMVFPGEAQTYGAIRFSEGMGKRLGVHMLPARPVWGGLAVNGAVFGAVVFVGASAPGMLRGRLRARRGACVRCGYDLRGLSACPECGA
jgi:hypothetical protein